MSNLRRMLIAKAMQKDSTKMGEEFCDADGVQIQANGLSNGDVLCWQNFAPNFSEDKYTDGSYSTFTFNDGVVTASVKTATDANRIGVIIGNISIENYYYIRCNYKVKANTICRNRLGDNTNQYYTITTDNWYNLTQIVKPRLDSNAYLRFYTNTYGLYAVGDTYQLKEPIAYDMSSMFRYIGYVPQTITEFEAIFGDSLGYTPYTSTPIPLIVHNGNLHYALTKEVRDYASKLGVLDALNEYCCEHKDMIAYINEWKYVIHSLVDTGYTSWLKGDGVAYIDTECYPTLEDEMDFTFNLPVFERSGLLGSGYAYNSSDTFMFGFWSNHCMGYIGGTNNKSLCSTSLGVINVKANINGANSYAQNFNGSFTNENGLTISETPRSYYLFKCNTANKDLQNPSKVCIKNFSLVQDGNSINYIPYYDTKSRTFGMLDTLDTNAKTRFHASANLTGEFTWSLTDASGSDVSTALDKVIELGIPVDNYKSALSNYQFVDYLESTEGGNQYIDTGIIPTDGTGFKIKTTTLGNITEGGLLASSTNGGKHYVVQNMNNALRLYIADIEGVTKNVTTFYSALNSSHIVEYNTSGNKEIKTDGSSIAGTTATYMGNSASNLFMFCRSNNNNAYNYNSYDVYFVCIYNDAIPNRIFIPCIRKSDNKPMMIDLITMTEYINKGTGDDFTYGDNKALASKILEI